MRRGTVAAIRKEGKCVKSSMEIGHVCEKLRWGLENDHVFFKLNCKNHLKTKLFLDNRVPLI